MVFVGLPRTISIWLLGGFGGVLLSLSSLAAAEELEEVLVRGERFERSFLETSSSVVVLDEKRLRQLAGADRIEQVLDQVANIQLGASDIAPAIRGQDATGVLIGAHAFLGGTRPRATLQIDGRALNFNEFVYGLSSIWDVKQIEVFRGPQTTTQGRNAIAGAIFIETNDPTQEFEGLAQVVAGNYATQQASFALSGPVLTEQLSARVAVDWRQHESWMQYTQPDIFVGADRENDNHELARLKLLFTPQALPDLQLKLTYNHLVASSPQGETADEPFEERIQNVQVGAHWDIDVDSAILRADYKLAPSWQLKLTTSASDSTSERFSPPGQGISLVEANEASAEGVLSFNPESGRFRGFVGLAYFEAQQDELSDLSAFLGFSDFNDVQRNVGLFAQGTADLSERLHLSLGGRWQQDSQDRVGTLGAFALDYDKTFSAFLPSAELAYDLDEQALVGFSARKGYNPGGTTISFVSGEVDEFAEESLWSYELFSRASLADGEWVLSGNLFFTQFSDAQRPLFIAVALPDGGTTFVSEFDNAPSAESYGVEFEAAWAATEWLHLRASLGYLHTEITETPEDNDPLLGREFQRSPSFNGVLAMSLRPIEPFTFDINIRYNDEYFSDDANTPSLAVNALTLVDLKARYQFGAYSVFGFVRNATDENYRIWQYREGNASLGDPREYGIGLEVRL